MGWPGTHRNLRWAALSAITHSQECALWKQAQPLLGQSGLYDQWMFGGGGIPHWTGFTIGYDTYGQPLSAMLILNPPIRLHRRRCAAASQPKTQD
jgi:uncharacterized protein YjaZ